MSQERFFRLVEEYQGFEFTLAYRDDVDHIIGGKGGTFWYVIAKNGKLAESWIASFQDGVWSDRQIRGRGAKQKIGELPQGSTIRRIAQSAYLMQEESWVKGRKPRLIEDAHPHYHYTYGFGDKALDVSAQYGVTIGYSDIHDQSAGFHLRDLQTGKDVELP